jgi:hypothetical protein
MRITWVSGDKVPQQVQYGDGKMQTSEVTTFSQDDMISEQLSFSFPTYMIDSLCHLCDWVIFILFFSFSLRS